MKWYNPTIKYYYTIEKREKYICNNIDEYHEHYDE